MLKVSSLKPSRKQAMNYFRLLSVRVVGRICKGDDSKSALTLGS